MIYICKAYIYIYWPVRWDYDSRCTFTPYDIHYICMHDDIAHTYACIIVYIYAGILTSALKLRQQMRMYALWYSKCICMHDGIRLYSYTVQCAEMMTGIHQVLLTSTLKLCASSSVYTYVCAYVYAYVYVYVYAYEYVYVYSYANLYMCMYMYTYVYVCVYSCTCVCIRICTCIHS